MKQKENKKVRSLVFYGSKLKRGFSVIEILIAGVIMIIVAGLIIVSISSFKKNQGLGNASDTVLNAINEARSKTLSSEGSLQYGVRFLADQVIVFAGLTYATSSTSTVYFLPKETEISTISLSGGVPNVIFQKITGKTDQPGYVTIRLKSAPATTKTLNIRGTGLVSI